MDDHGWFKLIKEHADKLLWIPVLASMSMFLANISVALSDDGIISESEFHNLVQGASGLELAVLALVMALLKVRR